MKMNTYKIDYRATISQPGSYFVTTVHAFSEKDARAKLRKQDPMAIEIISIRKEENQYE